MPPVDSVFLFDVARAAHMLGLAAGLGLAICADVLALKSLFVPVTASDARLMRGLHRIILAGLALLWASGLYLLQVRTGWEAAAFTPKLWTKLVIVALLTCNALVIGSYALPTYAAHAGQRFAGFGLAVRVRLSAIAGLSLSCWLSALALGVFRQLKPLSFEGLEAVFLPLFAASLTGALLVGYGAAAIARIGDLAIGAKPLPEREWPRESGTRRQRVRTIPL